MTEVDSSFDKDSRLLSTHDFKYLRSNSKILKNRFVRVYYKTSRLNSDISRIGFSVTKKVGKANKRNICKRVIREFFRHSQYRNTGHDFMVVVSNQLFSRSEKPSKDLREALETSFLNIQ